MTDIREYRKMRYMGDCKCGNCQLVPLDDLNEHIASYDVMMAALKLIGAVTRKDSLTTHERLHDIEMVVGRALISVLGPVSETSGSGT